MRPEIVIIYIEVDVASKKVIDVLIHGCRKSYEILASRVAYGAKWGAQEVLNTMPDILPRSQPRKKKNPPEES